MTNQASYIGWIEDRLSIPACLVTNDVLSSIIREDAEFIEYMQNMLVRCVNDHFSHDAKHDSEFAEQVRLSFLSGMHEVMFGFCIPDICRLENLLTESAVLEHIRHFHGDMEQRILSTFREVVQASGSTSKDLQLQVETQREVISIFRKNAREREKNYG